MIVLLKQVHTHYTIFKILTEQHAKPQAYDKYQKMACVQLVVCCLNEKEWKKHEASGIIHKNTKI